MTDDKFERRMDFAHDIFGVVGTATLVAFVALAWKRTGELDIALAVFSLFLTAYMVGRWHAGKSWERDMDLLRSHYRARLGEPDE